MTNRRVLVLVHKDLVPPDAPDAADVPTAAWRNIRMPKKPPSTMPICHRGGRRAIHKKNDNMTR